MAKKGQKFKMWSAEEKFNIIEPIIKFEKSSKLVTKETGINNGMITSSAPKEAAILLPVYTDTTINVMSINSQLNFATIINDIRLR